MAAARFCGLSFLNSTTTSNARALPFGQTSTCAFSQQFLSFTRLTSGVLLRF